MIEILLEGEVVGEVLAHVLFLGAIFGAGLVWTRITKGEWFPDDMWD